MVEVGEAEEEVAKMAKFFSRCSQSLAKSCRLFQAILELDELPEMDHVIENATQLSSRLMECDRSTFWIAERAKDGNLWTRLPRADGQFGKVSVLQPKTSGLVGACHASQ